ncbi:DUF3788 domain-containing protein [bacterium]|nr:DUF3788 domain-containing protein [bacterium]
MSIAVPKLPFNDHKHPPTRPEIDLQLGVLPAIELKRFEHKLELIEPQINWSMQWYENEAGWGYRASYRSRVVCVLHFYKGFFSVTLSVPIDETDDYLALKETTPLVRTAFEHFKLSAKMKWVTFNISRGADVDAVIAIANKKMADLRKKTRGAS